MCKGMRGRRIDSFTIAVMCVNASPMRQEVSELSEALPASLLGLSASCVFMKGSSALKGKGRGEGQGA